MGNAEFLDEFLQEKSSREIGLKFYEDFYIENDIDCVILVRKGKLRLVNCQIQFENIEEILMHKIPSIVALPESKLFIKGCNIKGDA